MTRPIGWGASLVSKVRHRRVLDVKKRRSSLIPPVYHDGRWRISLFAFATIGGRSMLVSPLCPLCPPVSGGGRGSSLLDGGRVL